MANFVPDSPLLGPIAGTRTPGFIKTNLVIKNKAKKARIIYFVPDLLIPRANRWNINTGIIVKSIYSNYFAHDLSFFS